MTSFSPCRAQNPTRSGTRAIVPSSFMISQTTPAAVSPASRARSTAASVWPERWSTPPERARSGNTWPGWTRSCGGRGGVDGDLDRPRPVGGGDAGRDAVARLDRDRERRAERRLVLVGHLAQAELVAALWREAQADQPAAVGRHEVDRVGRHELRRDRQVALVLAVLVVDDDDEPARPDLLDRLLDRGERAGLRLGGGAHPAIVARLSGPIGAHQPLDVLREHVDLEVHRRPGTRSPSVVAASVCGNERDGERVRRGAPRRSARRRRR